MGIKVNLIGKKFNRLTVIREAPKVGKSTSAFWVCRCDCGNETIVKTRDLKIGHSKSCGCLNSERTVQRNIQRTKHGHNSNGNKTHEYRIWVGIKTRCYNPNHTYFKYYGGRGIEMCRQWKHSFENFFAHVGKGPSIDHTIDRIDNDGNYEPGNVRWATAKEQANNRINTRRFNYRGEIKTISELMELSGISRSAIKYRLNRKWPIEKAMNKPVRKIKQLF